MIKDNQNFKNQNNMPLYPNEAYSQTEVQEEQKEAQNPLDNPLIPLLLSTMQGKESPDILKLLSSMSGGNQAGLIQALASNLTNKKKKESPENKGLSSKKPFPKNEFLY